MLNISSESLFRVFKSGVQTFRRHHVLWKICKISRDEPLNGRRHLQPLHRWLSDAVFVFAVAADFAKSFKFPFSIKSDLVEIWSNLKLAEAAASRDQRVSQNFK